eukprot:2672645-Rhodomonas_salina.1
MSGNSRLLCSTHSPTLTATPTSASMPVSFCSESLPARGSSIVPPATSTRALACGSCRRTVLPPTSAISYLSSPR